MAYSQKPIVVGPFAVGTWLYDCGELKSRVRLRESRPGLIFNIAIGAGVKDALVAGLSIFPGGVGGRIAEAVGKAAPEFSGSITVLTSAEPVFEICNEETKKQMVGWDYVILVIIKGKAKFGAVEVEIVMELPFTGEGERVSCDCNTAIDAEKISMLDEDIGVVKVTLTNPAPTVMVPLNKLEHIGSVKFLGAGLNPNPGHDEAAMLTAAIAMAPAETTAISVQDFTLPALWTLKPGHGAHKT